MQLGAACIGEHPGEKFLGQQVNVLWIVVRVAGDRYDHKPLGQSKSIGNRLVYLGDMLQNFQQGHHIEQAFLLGPITEVSFQDGQIAPSSPGDGLEQLYPMGQDLHGRDRRPGKLGQEGEQEDPASAAHIQQAFR